ncbi:MAG: hypothetical protein WC376_04680 [Candidatus Nanoarchaeia archaeon]|jgi:hypothetical protein
MKKTAIPVEAFYILAYLILMSLAGATLYFYIESQSLGPNYRISAASIIEESESIKKLVDQERLFVLETVIFFLGSQGGVVNLNEYNDYNISLIPASDSATTACLLNLKTLNNNQYPTKEISSRCITNLNYYLNPESIGAWKCDDKTRYYATCNNIGNFRVCCESFNAANQGFNCHEACLSALDFNVSYCQDKTFCGALWCKENNLEIPESFQGVQYYYKISQKYPGFFCPSPISYNPEYSYGPGVFWQGLDKNSIMKNLIDLSNKYFYLPNPNFKSYISRVYQKDLKIAFQLIYKGCNQESCEFSWVPNGESTQNFEITGLGGIPMVRMSSDILSLQSINIPLIDMIDYSREIIEGRKIEDFFSNTLSNNVLVKRESNLLPMNNLPKDWKNYFSKYSGTNDYGGVYDDSKCGQDYLNNNDYECLMQHVSTKLYSAISAPMKSSRESGMEFNLRPIFNFISSSLGGVIKVSNCGNNVCDFGETFQLCPNDCDWEAIMPNNINCEYEGSTSVTKICERFYPPSSRLNCRTNLNREPGPLGSGIDISKEPCVINGNSELEAFYNNKTHSGTVDICTYLLLARDCQKAACGDGVCDFTESYNSCPQDCSNLRLYCGDGIASTNENCPTETLSQKAYTLNLDSGKYSVFVKGNGNTTANLRVSTTSTNFEFSISAESNGEYYTQATMFDNSIGRCSYNTYLPERTLSYYKSFGCCPLANYTTAGCQVEVTSNNAYCTQMNNGYGMSQVGSYCSLNNPDSGRIDYDLDTFDLPSPAVITVTVSNLKGSIESIEIIRMQYDNTFNVTSTIKKGVNVDLGGSYEYYTGTKECVSAIGANAVNYDAFSNDELWYSMLCLRSKGHNWINIIENYTSLFNKFELELGETQKNSIDDFIKTYNITLSVVNGEVMVTYTNDCPIDGCSFQLKENPELLWNYKITEPMQTFAENELIINRLREIQQSTNYLSLPIKWIFAYNDKVRIDQSNSELKDNAACDLVYDEVTKKSAPDCGCKNNCEDEILCNFNFSALPMNEIVSKLYHFKAIFIDNQTYKANGVVGSQ